MEDFFLKLEERKHPWLKHSAGSCSSCGSRVAVTLGKSDAAWGLLATLLAALALAAGESICQETLPFADLGSVTAKTSDELCYLLCSYAWHIPMEGASLSWVNSSHLVSAFLHITQMYSRREWGVNWRTLGSCRILTFVRLWEKSEWRLVLGTTESSCSHLLCPDFTTGFIQWDKTFAELPTFKLYSSLWMLWPHLPLVSYAIFPHPVVKKMDPVNLDCKKFCSTPNEHGLHLHKEEGLLAQVMALIGGEIKTSINIRSV